MNWDLIREEASQLLSDYLKIDTSNPPGKELSACNWLSEILAQEQIEYKIINSDDSRGNLIAGINNDLPSNTKVILLNHIDVVPAIGEDWSFDPFSGLVKNSFVHGRGSLDMKGMAIIELMTLILLKRNNYFKRNIVFMATADEESGSEFGIEYIAKNHKDFLQADFVINEGGIGTINAFKKQEKIFNIGISEKSPLWINLIVNGKSGHGSKQNFESATMKMIEVLQKILDHNFPLTISEEAVQYYNYLRQANIIEDDIDSKFYESIIENDSYANSLLHNSIALTKINGGYKNNVVPSKVSAALDIRLVPGYNPESFLLELKNIINDDQIIIEKVFSSSTKTSSVDNEIFSSIQQSIKSVIPDALVAPYITTGFTDSRVFRRIGVPSYGFIPILVNKTDLRGIHGLDEKISIDNLLLGIKILYDLVNRLD
ncbi:MAG: M20/M25/M40 family metallo-hydrolase [Dehalococcoidia bacterium]|nr:M20/M25/M40 family metallo-hydrolase [Dehalococcoidia bacterium]